jgi:hypothetical protein
MDLHAGWGLEFAIEGYTLSRIRSKPLQRKRIGRSQPLQPLRDDKRSVTNRRSRANTWPGLFKEALGTLWTCRQPAAVTRVLLAVVRQGRPLTVRWRAPVRGASHHDWRRGRSYGKTLRING